MNNNKIVLSVSILALLVAILGLYMPVSKVVQQSFGGAVNYDEVDATAIKIGGTNGSRVGPVISSTCTLIVAAGTVAASTTAPFDCAVTGVVSGDTVLAEFATSTGSTAAASWTVIGAKASTTAGFITLVARNDVGAAANISATGLGSTTNVLVTHPVTSVPGL